jgi:hypothetical protein
MRIRPSDARKAIDDLLHSLGTGSIGYQYMHQASGLLDAVEHVPDELVETNLSDHDRLVFIVSRGNLAGFVASCRTLASNAPGLDSSILPRLSDILSRCRDEVIPNTIAGLEFVTDHALRHSLRSDLTSVDSSIRVRDWKSATVIAGSAVEALLLSALLDDTTAAIDKFRACYKDVELEEWIHADDPTTWALAHFAKVAHKLDRIQESTHDQLKLVRQYRNLIHAGAARRTGTTCDISTAHGAISGLYAVIRDLTPQ